MALPSSGSISMLQVRNELSDSGAISLNDANVRALFVDASGQISMSQGWGKSAFNANWSGTSSNTVYRLSTSGHLARFGNVATGGYGAWSTAYTAGTFSSVFSYDSATDTAGNYGFKFGTAGGGTNKIRMRYNVVDVATNITFTVSGGFTGSSIGSYYYSGTSYNGLQTSSGQIRVYNRITDVNGVQTSASYGAWIRLI